MFAFRVTEENEKTHAMYLCWEKKIRLLIPLSLILFMHVWIIIDNGVWEFITLARNMCPVHEFSAI